jgi:hypothetical protein
MKFSKARYEKYMRLSLEAWINLIEPGDQEKPLPLRTMRKYVKQLSKADFEIGRMWEANEKYERERHGL